MNDFSFWNTPDGYDPSSYCASCGKDFAGDTYFDRHRTGTHDPDTRRCKSTIELIEDGMRPMTDDEMRASRRHSHRVGYGIEMWFDPASVERARKGFSAVK